jgi:hypothetical protein
VGNVLRFKLNGSAMEVAAAVPNRVKTRVERLNRRSCGRISLPQTKNGAGRVMYLNDLAQQVLAASARGKPMERVFAGVPPARVNVAFIRACKEAGIEDFTLLTCVTRPRAGCA